MTEIQLDNQRDLLTKLYSDKAIGIATFIGGPLAAGILVRQNFKNLGRSDLAKSTLFISIISTILLIVIIFSIPEQIIDKIPNIIIPSIYTGIIYLIVDKYQGQTLKIHKENGGLFYSNWKAAGVGAVSMIVFLLSMFAYVYFMPDGFDTLKYDNGIAEFSKNEKEAMLLFNLLETEDTDKIVSFIQNTGLPAWHKNLQILDELDGIKNIYPQLKEQNMILREYCLLRIESCQIIEKSILEDVLFEHKIQKIHSKIDKLLSRL